MGDAPIPAKVGKTKGEPDEREEVDEAAAPQINCDLPLGCGDCQTTKKGIEIGGREAEPWRVKGF
jgi:hypothetical protein